VPNFLHSAPVKEFWKSVNICPKIWTKVNGTFLD